MSRQTLKARVKDTFLKVVAIGHRYRSKPHQTSVAVVETITFCSEIRSLSHKLIHRDRDIASETDGVRPTSVVEAMLEPHMEHKPEMFGIEVVVS